MNAPRWARAVLRWLAPPGRADEIEGDLEEAHRARVRTRGRLVGGVVTAFETADMALALLRQRGFGLGVSWLDIKLGLRMLVRYPGLTALGGLAIAFAIFAGAGTFEFLTQVAHPTLPFEQGDRLVGIQLWDAREGDDRRRAAFDYGVWQDELTTLDDIGAYASVARNLIAGQGGAYLLRGAEIDAAGFRVTGVEPLLGRTLTEDDERPSAPLVVVVGYEVWQNVFAADPEVVGRAVRVGVERATVVGVMPEGYAFPVAHELWLPMRLDARSTLPGEGPGISVFGRLAPNATLADAQTELSRIAERLAAAFPETHQDVRPFVKPFARAMLGLPASFSDRTVSLVALAWNIPLVAFLVLVCGNVALLMFARAAAREGELVVRSALGAGRRRIVGQLFAEALLLALLGAAIGLAAARYGMRWAYHLVEAELWGGALPFWFAPELSTRAVLYTLGLTLLGATVAGVLPALKATRGLGQRLREGTAGGGGMRFGGVWTVVIVLQIGITVVAPAITFAVTLEGKRIENFDLGIPAHEFLSAQIAIQPPEEVRSAAETELPAFRAQVRATLDELEEKLLADPLVAGVTVAELPPRGYTGWHQIEVDGPTAPPQDERGHRMGSVSVEVDFFETLGVEPVAGRDFRSADARVDSRSVIVNEAFIDYVLGGRNAVGVDLRYVASERNRPPGDEPGPWYEIVGVVQDLGPMSGYSGAVVYHPAVRGHIAAPYVIARTRGQAAAYGPTLRRIAYDVDPTLRMRDPVTLDRVVQSDVDFYRFWIGALVMISTVAVVLSLGGIYAVMAFTVSRRTREIGVRVALGAPRRKVVMSIFRRPLVQVASGIALGGIVTAVLMGLAGSDASPLELAVFTLYLAVMTGVCLTACVVPTRRALAVEPSEALRSE